MLQYLLSKAISLHLNVKQCVPVQIHIKPLRHHLGWMRSTFRHRIYLWSDNNERLVGKTNLTQNVKKYIKLHFIWYPSESAMLVSTVAVTRPGSHVYYTAATKPHCQYTEKYPRSYFY